MTSNSDAAVKRYVERMAKIYGEIAALTDDVKEIGIEAKAEGHNPEMLKRWAKAIATDRQGELAAKTVLQGTIGELVAPEAFDKLANPDEEEAPTAGAARH